MLNIPKLAGQNPEILVPCQNVLNPNNNNNNLNSNPKENNKNVCI